MFQLRKPKKTKAETRAEMNRAYASSPEAQAIRDEQRRALAAVRTAVQWDDNATLDEKLTVLNAGLDVVVDLPQNDRARMKVLVELHGKLRKIHEQPDPDGKILAFANRLLVEGFGFKADP